MEHGGITTVQEYYNQVILKNTDKWVKRKLRIPKYSLQQKGTISGVRDGLPKHNYYDLNLTMLYSRWQNKTW